MFTLHDTIELTKKAAIFAVVGAVIIFIIFLLFRLGVFIKNTFFPDAPPPAQIAFGKLPTITFGESIEGNFSYSVDTLSGELPVVQQRVNVYELVEPSPEFFDYSRAKTKAGNLKIPTEPTKISEAVYEWVGINDLRPDFTINIVTNDFFYKTDYLTYAPIAASTKTINEETAENEAKSFFEKLNSFPDTINTASTSATSYSIRDGALVNSTSGATTTVIRLDYYPQAVEQLPIYYPYYPQSLMYAVVTTEGGRNAVVEASYVEKIVSETKSDYPIKTVDEAYKELEEGNAHLTSAPGNETSIAITDVRLGYFMGSGEQRYLMPVFVFIGNDGLFTALVSAVQNEYIE